MVLRLWIDYEARLFQKFALPQLEWNDLHLMLEPYVGLIAKPLTAFLIWIPSPQTRLWEAFSYVYCKTPRRKRAALFSSLLATYPAGKFLDKQEAVVLVGASAPTSLGVLIDEPVCL